MNAERSSLFTRGVLALLSIGAGSAVAAPIEIDLAAPPADTFRIQADNILDQFGGRSSVCDLNGDGVPDLVVGAIEADGIQDGRAQAGEITIYFGARRRWQGGGPSQSLRNVTIVGQEALDALGGSTACGDVDGDGFADIIAGASEADGPNNQRMNAGQIHIIKGRTSWPAVIDLATDPGTIIYGAHVNDYIGTVQSSVGDMNGDGLNDIVVSSDRGAPKTGTGNHVGIAHVLFGRRNWPATIDLSYQSDITIYGKESNDNLGTNSTLADFDLDGTADLFISAVFASGVGNARLNCGEAYVWRGRSVWPPEFDLATTSPETMIEGVDADDWLGDYYDVAVGDLDADGKKEIICPLRRADGPSNTKVNAGEMRSYEVVPHSTLPSLIDLKTQTTSVVYGADAGDALCLHLYVGDVNADGTDDLLCGADYGDGPANSRADSGEVRVVYGKIGFPASRDLAVSPPDISIWGSRSMTRSTLVGLSDVNGDGLSELVALDDTPGNWNKPTLYLISPIDVDGDGINALADNCPLVANPDQVDTDGDGRGDLCQLDWDGDGQNDSQDCAPVNKNGGVPAEVLEVGFAAGTKGLIVWNSTAFATTYDITRGGLPRASSSDFGVCQDERDADLSDTQFIDGDRPAPAKGFFYLVRARNSVCPALGSWGKSSGGVERQNTNPSACP